MANQQLIDFIKQQMGAGERKETVKSTLRASGWGDAEVDEAMAVVGGTDTSIAAVSESVTRDIFKPRMAASAKSAGTPSIFALHRSSRRWGLPASLGAIILVLVLGGGWLYKTSADLSGQVARLSGENAAFTYQIVLLSKENNSLRIEADSLRATSSDLEDQLSILIVPSGTSMSQELPVNVKGTLAGSGSAGYTITTSRGIVLTIKNYRDAKVATALLPLVGTTIGITGTHLPGSKSVTVASVNGIAIQ